MIIIQHCGGQKVEVSSEIEAVEYLLAAKGFGNDECCVRIRCETCTALSVGFTGRGRDTLVEARIAANREGFVRTDQKDYCFRCYQTYAPKRG